MPKSMVVTRNLQQPVEVDGSAHALTVPDDILSYDPMTNVLSPSAMPQRLEPGDYDDAHHKKSIHDSDDSDDDEDGELTAFLPPKLAPADFEFDDEDEYALAADDEQAMAAVDMSQFDPPMSDSLTQPVDHYGR